MADNTKSTGSSKKKKIAASALAVALAAALLAGSTLSYLQDTSDDVENDFNPHGNSVSISESGATDEDEDGTYTQEFDIVPGTSETKDPTVTATYTLDSYVFLLVDDDTQELVDYEINTAETDDDGSTSGIWTLLYSEDESPIEGYAIYYKLVTTEDTTDTSSGITVSSTADEDVDDEEESEDDGDSATVYTEVLNVIKNNTVSYSNALTNEDMVDEDGNLLTGITLSFKALIIQAEPFDNAAEALSGYLGQLGAAETDYDSDDTSDTILKVSLNTTVANSKTDNDGNPTTTSTTFTLTIPASTTIVGTATTTSTDEDGNETTSTTNSTPTSLTLKVTETTADTVAVVPDGDAGDYTYKISLVDQDGNSVSATSGYMNVAIQIKTGITASNLIVTKLGDESDTTLSTISNTTNISTEGYTYDSSTGVLTIYTQSLGEYEISWNDTGLSLSALSGDDLTFTNTMYSALTVTALAGVKVNDSNQQESGGHSSATQYDDWAIEVCMTTDTDLSKVVYATCYTSTNSSMQGQARNYINASYTANETVGIVAKSFGLGNLVYSQLDIMGTGGTTTNGHSTGNGNWKYYNVKTGFYSSTSMSGKSVTFELRLYEGTSNSTSTYTTTGKYIILDTLTVEIS